METRIRCHHYKDILNDGHDRFEPLEEGPSCLRLVCRLTLPVYGEPSWIRASESNHPRRLGLPRLPPNAAHGLSPIQQAAAGLRDLRPLAQQHVPRFTPNVMACNILREECDNENKGRGGHYNFSTSPRAWTWRTGVDARVQRAQSASPPLHTLDLAPCGDRCGICLDGLDELE
ncbi:unnamed protein product [Urochloa humidicola]